VWSKSVKGLRRCGGSKMALSYYFGQWLIQQLVLPYKPWSWGQGGCFAARPPYRDQDRVEWQLWKLYEASSSLPFYGKWASQDSRFVFVIAPCSFIRSFADADKPAQRVWRSIKVTKHSTKPIHMLGIVSYCAIVTLSLRRAVFTIFNFKKCRDLEMGSKVTQDHWEWYHSIDGVWFPISVL